MSICIHNDVDADGRMCEIRVTCFVPRRVRMIRLKLGLSRSPISAQYTAVYARSCGWGVAFVSACACFSVGGFVL